MRVQKKTSVSSNNIVFINIVVHIIYFFLSILFFYSICSILFYSIFSIFYFSLFECLDEFHHFLSEIDTLLLGKNGVGRLVCGLLWKDKVQIAEVRHPAMCDEFAALLVGPTALLLADFSGRIEVINRVSIWWLTRDHEPRWRRLIMSVVRIYHLLVKIE